MLRNSFSSILGNIPLVVRNLLIINIVLAVLTYLLEAFINLDLFEYLALYYPESDMFQPFQYVTYMFMHAKLSSSGFAHILFNMFALWMFGRVIEQVWGAKRFFIYYISLFFYPCARISQYI